MQLVQLSSAQGPLECSVAVEKALSYFISQLDKQKITYELLEKVEDRIGLKSVLLSLDIDEHHPLVFEWQGTHQWIWQSKIRPKHQRKNWFFGVAFFSLPEEMLDSEIHYKATTSQGAGGQHVNKTASAIQAVHIATGIAVKVQSERSQHANKRLAKLLIQQKLSERAEDVLDEAGKMRRLVHHQLERGQALKTFEGDHFKLRS